MPVPESLIPLIHSLRSKALLLTTVKLFTPTVGIDPLILDASSVLLLPNVLLILYLPTLLRLIDPIVILPDIVVLDLTPLLFHLDPAVIVLDLSLLLFLLLATIIVLRLDLSPIVVLDLPLLFHLDPAVVVLDLSLLLLLLLTPIIILGLDLTSVIFLCLSLLLLLPTIIILSLPLLLGPVIILSVFGSRLLLCLLLLRTSVAASVIALTLRRNIRDRKQTERRKRHRRYC